MLRSVGVRLALALAGVGMTCVPAWAQSDAQSDLAANQALLDRYCVTCHNSRLETAGLDLSRLDLGAVGETPARWEAVVRKLRGGMMPPR